MPGPGPPGDCTMLVLPSFPDVPCVQPVVPPKPSPPMVPPTRKLAAVPKVKPVAVHSTKERDKERRWAMTTIVLILGAGAVGAKAARAKSS